MCSLNCANPQQDAPDRPRQLDYPPDAQRHRLLDDAWLKMLLQLRDASTELADIGADLGQAPADFRFDSGYPYRQQARGRFERGDTRLDRVGDHALPLDDLLTATGSGFVGTRNVIGRCRHLPSLHRGVAGIGGAVTVPIAFVESSILLDAMTAAPIDEQVKPEREKDLQEPPGGKYIRRLDPFE